MGMNVTLRQLNAFCAVYEHRSFTRAAEELCITQSAVSKLCAELEEEIGCSVFSRTTRTVEICEGAAELYKFAQEIQGSLRAAERSLSQLQGLERGSITIATSQIIMHTLLGSVIKQFHLDHPNVKFELHESATDQTIELVINGHADFGIVALEEGTYPKLVTEVLQRDSMFAVMPPNHTLALRPYLCWEDLAPYQHIGLRSVYSVRRAMDRILAEKNIEFPFSIQTGTLSTGLQFVRMGLGITVMPGYIRGFARQLGLTCVRIHDDTEHMHELSLISRAGDTPSIATQAFIERLRVFLIRSQADDSYPY